MLAFLFALFGAGAVGSFAFSRSDDEPAANPPTVADPIAAPAAPRLSDPAPDTAPDTGPDANPDTGSDTGPTEADSDAGPATVTIQVVGLPSAADGHQGAIADTTDGEGHIIVVNTGPGPHPVAVAATHPEIHPGHDTSAHTGAHTGPQTGHHVTDTGHMDGHTDGGGSHSSSDHDLPKTPEEIEAFVAMVRAANEPHAHDMADPRMGEHMQVMDLVAPAEATHIAIGNGSWFDPGNWHNGEVPGEGAMVVIPEPVTLSYDAISPDSLLTLRIDGQLDFATDTDSSMLIDTLIVTPTGTLTAGTKDTPVAPDVTVEIVIAGNGAIDTDWDPGLFSRGIISHGKTEIYGQAKDSHEKVTEDPMTGDTSLRFDGLPDGWQVGDTIVIAGTHYDGYEYQLDTKTRDYQGTEDEVRVISAIEGDRVYFEDPLEFDHDTPRDDLHTSVANYSRNVTIRSEKGDDSEIYERGHVMLMHSDDVDVRYAAFQDLGRTDKSQDLFGTGEAAEGSIGYDSNVGGRYALHLHRTGVDDLENPTVLAGNAVFGSPGWGFVHHDSNALLENNASFDTYGAGYVAETGNETGAWNDNIAINAQGVNWGLAKTENNVKEFDIGKTGDGFWFTGRMVEATDNVAASVNHGFIYMHRGPLGEGGKLPFDAEVFSFTEALTYDEEVRTSETPILVADGNEAFASHIGLHVVKANPIQGHDIHSVISDFTGWNVIVGADLEYTAHYVLNEFDLVARDGRVPGNVKEGIVFGNNTFDMSITNSSVSGFENGIDLKKSYSHQFADAPDDHKFAVINTQVTESEKTDYAHFDPALDVRIDTPVNAIGAPTLTLDAPLLYAPSTGHTVSISGTKTDSLGSHSFPQEPDNYDLDQKEIIRLLEEHGYYTTEDGSRFMIFNIYLSDSLTGDIFTQGHLIEIDASYPLGNQYKPWADAKFNGETTKAALDEMIGDGAELVSRADALKQFSLEAHDARLAEAELQQDADAHLHMQGMEGMAHTHQHAATHSDLQSGADIHAMQDAQVLTLNIAPDLKATPEVMEDQASLPAKKSLPIDVMEDHETLKLAVLSHPKSKPLDIMEQPDPDSEMGHLLTALTTGQGYYSENMPEDEEDEDIRPPHTQDALH